ncbi:MAG: hypothetical protein AVDCRST_MAG19-1307, partial [uncultured Thermomicrobiales bacterium]
CCKNGAIATSRPPSVASSASILTCPCSWAPGRMPTGRTGNATPHSSDVTTGTPPSRCS